LAKQESLQRYRLPAAYSAGKTVLDVGCGYGYGSYMLSLNARRVVGIDEYEEAIQTAKARYMRKNLDFHHAEAIDYLSGSQRYDLVVMFEVIEHVARQDLLLQLVQNALNRGGHLLLSTPNRRYTPFYRRNPYHVHEFLPRELLNLVEKYFTVEHFYGQVPGGLVMVPLPWFLLMHVVQHLPNARKFVEISSRPEVCRTMIVVLRPRVAECMIENSE
jgi:2-polyprenyl-3-methyl-5-hydroxy-6-metoxy-1,4-benzoquinol methylase